MLVIIYFNYSNDAGSRLLFLAFSRFTINVSSEISHHLVNVNLRASSDERSCQVILGFEVVVLLPNIYFSILSDFAGGWKKPEERYCRLE